MNSSSKFLQTLDLSPSHVFSQETLIVVHEKCEKQDKESPIDGSFIFQLLLAEYYSESIPRQVLALDSGSESSSSGSSWSLRSKRVLLILNHQTEKHWNLRCSKLGLNLETMKSTGNLIIIDTLKQQFEQLMETHQVKTDPEINTKSKFSLGLCNPNLQQLLNQIITSIDTLYAPPDSNTSPKPNLLIIIENLTSLFYTSSCEPKQASAAVKNVLEFLRILRTYRNSELDICLATLVRSDNNNNNSSSENEPCQQNRNYLANMITDCFESITFEVLPLSTGYFEEIHGKVNVKSNNKSYHYKIEDRNVKFVSIV